MKIKLLVLSLFFVLTGCSSMSSYNEPSSGSQPLATVSGSSDRNGLFEWNTLSVTSIDDKQIGMVWSVNSKINVVPGRHLFVISSQFNRGFMSGGPFNSITEVYATVRPGMHYRFVGKPYGATMTVWAEDDFGRPASPVAASNYQQSARPTFVTVYSKQ